MAAWASHPRIEIVGAATPARRLPIFALRIRDGAGGHVHHQLFTRLLSDVHGIQARGGCACAGPYAHRLLGIGRDASERLRADIRAGIETEKPGWTRLNFSYLIDDPAADFIIAAVTDLADRAPDLARRYACDAATARFTPRAA